MPRRATADHGNFVDPPRQVVTPDEAEGCALPGAAAAQPSQLTLVLAHHPAGGARAKESRNLRLVGASGQMMPNPNVPATHYLRTYLCRRTFDGHDILHTPASIRHTGKRLAR